MYHGYGAPDTFCFDIKCGATPVMDDPDLDGYNVKERADEFMKYFRKQSEHYKSNHIMHNFGSDFQYMNA